MLVMMILSGEQMLMLTGNKMYMKNFDMKEQDNLHDIDDIINDVNEFLWWSN